MQWYLDFKGTKPLKSLRDRTFTDKELLHWLRSRPQIKRDPKTNCKEWQKSTNKNGYGITSYKGKVYLAHRLVWYLDKGYWPKDQIMHKCDNPRCINIKHMSEGTNADNVRDKMHKGRFVPNLGSKSGMAKFTEKKVLKIRKMHKTGKYSYSSLGRIFGVDYSTISSICNRKTWKHI